MNDPNKDNKQLIEENAALREQIAALEAQLAQSQQTQADQRQINESLPLLVATAGSDGLAEKALAEGESRLLEAQEVANLGFYVVDLVAGRWTSSPVLDRIFGISADYARTTNGWANLIDSDDRQAMLDYFFKDVVGEKQPFDREYRIVRQTDAELRWVHGRGRLQFDQSGQPVSMLGTIQDITERKQAQVALQQAHDVLERRVAERTGELRRANELLQTELEQRRQAEEALRESEQRMQMALEVSRSFAFEWDVANDRVLRSDGSSRVLGLTGDEARHETGQAFFQRIHVDDRDRLMRMLGELKPPAKTYRTEYRVLRGDGSTIVLEETARGFFDPDGKLCRLVGVSTDITERKRAEAELRASKERFELVVRGAGVGIWDWDIRTGSVYYSSGWKRLLGYGENEIGDGFDDWARLLHPEERDRIIKFQEDFLAGTSSSVTAEYRLRHQDGSYRWIAAHAVVVRDEQGKAIRLVGSHADVSDRKRAEEKVKAEQQALRRMVLAGDHERRLITYELHDGVAQQILGAKMLLGSQQPSQGRKSKAADAYRDGMAALAQASLEIRRVMNWLRTPVLDRFGLVEAIEDIASQLRLMPDAPEIECCHEVKFQRLEPTLENSLFRIAQEAMTNACRHSKSEKLQVKLTQKGGDVALEVRDWGIGFDQDTVHENRFGLDGIRERARILGGKLRIKSKPGEGTVIRARFPLIEAVDAE
jgi:PAS domain S-box-containing protein